MARGVEKLKALSVARLSKKPGLYNDGAGLCLRVTPPSACSWVLRYMLDGKAHEMGLGRYPDISLAEARLMAAEARKLKATGIDPITNREAVRTKGRLEAARSVTFRHCAESYIAAQKPSWKNAKHADQWAATLETYAMPLMADLPVQSIDIGMVHKVLEPIWSSKTETASRVRGRIESILDWATVREFRTGDNPARWKGHLESLFPARSKVQKVKHHPALPYAQMGTFMASLKAQEGNGALAMQFTILTAARTREVTEAKWKEFDLDAGVWTIPDTRMKAGREHRVPLPKASMAILRVRQKSGNKSPFVFPGSKQGKSISNMAMLQTLRRMERDDLTVHGFRSTFRDWAAEQTAFAREVAEAALAHTIGDKVEAAYRRGDLFEKRRKLMDAWATYCGTAKPDGKVIPIRGKK
jgi:integrase